jgi:branched-chain amino acid aminotransferase
MSEAKIIWHDGQFIPGDKATVNILSHSLHYGSGAFEGIRFYQTDNGPQIFKLTAHVKRLFYSANVLGLTIPYSEEEVFQAIVATVKKNELDFGYIRPLAFWRSGDLRIASTNLIPSLMIACWSTGQYLPSETVNVKVSDFIRLHPKSTIADAKLCGNYINSILASREIENTDYHEVLLEDYEGNIAEGAGENFFYVKSGIIYTPLKHNILPGITRDTVIALTKQLGIALVEKNITVQEALKADEAFFCGTAVEITGIAKLNDTLFNEGKMGPISEKIKTGYHDIVRGKNPDFAQYLTLVKSK